MAYPEWQMKRRPNVQIEDVRVSFRRLEETGALDNVVLAYLFGSHARGQGGPLSDVDIAVLLRDGVPEGEAFEKRLLLMAEIGYQLGRDVVDLLILNYSPLALAYRVLRDGILLYCRDEAKRIAFAAQTVSMYLDFKPILERHERAILERACRGELLHGYNPHHSTLERYRQIRERLKEPPGADL
ncbi:MAG: type VII toxin-antitoxin system MntA family adenylyltransferase antitoxin [Roseiflexus sp.]